MQASGVVAITLQDAGLWGQKDVLDLTEKARDFVRSELLPGFEPFFDLTP